MRLKLVLGVLLCLFSNSYAGIMSNLEVTTLDSPTYLPISLIHLEIQNDVIQSRGFSGSLLEIKYILSSGKTISEVRDELSLDRKIQCIRDSGCFLNNLLLSPSFYERSCSIEVSIRGTKLNISQNHSWGSCKEFEVLPKQDLTTDSLVLGVNEKEVNLPLKLGEYNEVSLSGSFNSDQDYVAIGFNFENKVVWSSRIYSDNSFSELISPSMFNNLCNLQIIVDPYALANDHNLENNLKKINFGNCAQGPLAQYPDIQFTSNDTNLFIFNSNDKKVVEESIGLSFRVFDENGNKVKEFLRYLDGGLGYLEFSSFSMENILNSNDCHLEVDLNFNREITELNYSNNKIVLNKCNSRGN